MPGAKRGKSESEGALWSGGHFAFGNNSDPVGHAAVLERLDVHKLEIRRLQLLQSNIVGLFRQMFCHQFMPFPITFTQMAWFVVSVFAVMLLGNLPPLSFIDGAFLKYFGVPFALTWFMCQKTFDGKKPYGFLKSVLAYLVRPKLTYAGKPVKLEKEYPAQPITAVRSDIYGISD